MHLPPEQMPWINLAEAAVTQVAVVDRHDGAAVIAARADRERIVRTVSANEAMLLPSSERHPVRTQEVLRGDERRELPIQEADEELTIGHGRDPSGTRTDGTVPRAGIAGG